MCNVVEVVPEEGRTLLRRVSKLVVARDFWRQGFRFQRPCHWIQLLTGVVNRRMRLADPEQLEQV
jgi:hypothetical protein